MLRNRFTLAALGLAGALVLAACGDDDDPGSSDVVATVNGTDITAAEVDTQFEIISQSAAGPAEGTTQEEHDRQLTINGLNQLIFGELLLYNASEMGLEAADDDIKAMRDQLIVQYGGEDEMYELLAEQGWEREDVDLQIMILATQDVVIDSFVGEVTDDDIAAAYEEGVSARHILVADEAAATAVIDRLDAGEDFAAVAAEVSSDQGSAANGGALGFTGPGIFVPEFDEALFGAEVGEVVGPVETDFGFHVIERLAKPALDEVESQIRNQLEQQRDGEAQDEFGVLIDEWVADADVVIHDTDYGYWDTDSGLVVPELSTETEAPESDDSTPSPEPTE